MVSAVEAARSRLSGDTSRRARSRAAHRRHLVGRGALIVLVGLACSAMAAVAAAHPMGNFSISHYSGLTVSPDHIELRYLIDMAEIPTFQEIQDSAIVAEAGHPGLDGYLARKAERLKSGLVIELNGQRLTLRGMSRTVLFSPGAGELPTMKLGLVYRTALPAALTGLNQLRYQDLNFPDRAGWKEVVAEARSGVALATSSVPGRDRSRQLTDYPTDLMNSPPQTLEASLTFALEALPSTASDGLRASARADEAARRPSGHVAETGPAKTPHVAWAASAVTTDGTPLALQPNRQAPRRDRFADLIVPGKSGLGVAFLAALVAAALGALHALEPGHGKAVVAAYLVGSRGTARHALLLGLVVTASHTAGVYLLGGVTLYASRYVVPEQLYPWLGALSGLTIAGLGSGLFLRRYAAGSPAHGEHHAHPRSRHSHGAHGDHGHADHAHGEHGHHHPHGHHHHLPSSGKVSFRELLALGVTGGIVPCPAALVVLLSAVALRRVGLGLLLIAAFSVGLAVVLIGIGLLVVYARRLMARVEGTGPLITRWLPLTSSATITVLGIAIAAQALVNAGVLTIRLG